MCLHGGNNLFLVASSQPLVVALSWQQSSHGCIEAIMFWIHRGTNLVVAALRQQSRCGCIKAKNFVETASSQSPRCTCIKATISWGLHRGSKLVVNASMYQFRSDSIEPTLSLWLHQTTRECCLHPTTLKGLARCKQKEMVYSMQP